MPQRKSKRPRSNKKQIGFFKWIRLTHSKLLSVAFMFAFVGLSTFVFTQLPRSQAATGHHAQCTYINPSKTIVNPGEQFTARVTMLNDGTTTFSPDYAFYLADPYNIWNFKGNTVTRNIPPKYSITFDLTLTAPSQSGTHAFGAEMAIVFQGSFPNACDTKSITVRNTTPPSITLAPSSNQVAQGSALSLTWRTSNAVSCSASGNWSGAKALSGTENRGGDTATTGTRTYALTCANSNNVSNTVSTTVNVVAAQSAPPPSSPTAPSPTQPPATRPSAPTTSPRLQVPGTPDNPAPPDTEPPSTPQNVRGEVSDSEGTVSIYWDEPSDNIGVTKYQVERSINQVDWTSLTDSLTPSEYTDTTANFESQYYYRVRAFDAANNASPYGSTEITTSTFKANVTSKQGGTVLSYDDKVSVTFPADAVTVDSLCSIGIGDEMPILKDSYATVLGPYKVSCKSELNDVYANFPKPLIGVLSTDADEDGELKITDSAVLGENGWDVMALDVDGDQRSFRLEPGSSSFALVSERTSTPLILKILIFVVMIGLIVGAIVFVLYIKYRKQQYAKYDDYIHKMRGY